jgi:tetratricopeptide (TPR) repeat protein/tRNA A-37 threonylcarbamoyl transferase component Bud32
MPEPLELASPESDDDVETQAMVRRLQARLFDMPVAPVRVGHFELLRVIGSGGMGVVHLGRDELLDRQVAIKLIRSERTQSEPARARLLREAQLMARVSHPNVVHVYEAGEHAGRVFVAMELVEGQTLRQWIDGEGRSRPWRERLQVLRAAGRGLAAAHRAGVIHRDFKPENVLLDANGEAKVGDFGLAGVEVSSSSTVDAPLSLSSALDSPGSLTQTGAVLGTPLYMAPEQLEARTVDARSDQFAFCVVAYELLVGQRPFAAETLFELSERVSSGAVRPVPSDCPAPRWLLAVILRGLTVDPAQRWPSMEALVEAMTPRRRWLGVFAAAGVTGLALALSLAWAWPSAPTDEGAACERGRSLLADAWDPARRDATERALLGTNLPYAADTFSRVASTLDAYASDWADGYYQACSDEQSGQAVDARMACLERAHQQLRSLTDELLLAHPKVVRHAADLVLSLPELERCDDPSNAQLEVASLDDPEVRALLDRLARATVLVESWQWAEADTLLAELGAAAQTMQLDPVLARVGVLRSAAAIGRGELDEAERFARDALAAAERAQLEELELLAWRRLATASRRKGELARAAFELERAETIAARPTISARHRADLLFDHADLLRRQIKHDAAVSSYEDARAAYHALSPEHPQIAGVLSDMALSLMALGRQDEAIAASEQALVLATERLGPQHPALVLALSSVADQYMDAGRIEDALTLRLRALAILEQQPTENPGYQVRLAAVIGGDLVNLRRFDEAEPVLAQAERIASERLPAEHPALAAVANSWGSFEIERRRPAAAVPHLERALALTPEDDPTLTRLVVLTNLSISLARAGRTDEALTRAEQTRATMAPLASDSAARVSIEIYLAEVDRLAGRHAQAEASFTRALELMDRVEIGDDLRVMALFGLARLESDHARAREYATRAEQLVDELPALEHERSEIETWLAEHP